MTDPRYTPVDGSPWRLSMGLRRLDPDCWLEVDDHRAEELDAKARLLDTARDVVVATLAGSEPPCEELRSMIVAHVGARRPGLDTSGSRAGPADWHPIVAAALLVQEDLCVLERLDGDWRLTAACVCFPSRWSLTEKLGQTLGGIHAPVPGFREALLGPTSTFFDRLTAERPVWRLNWTLLDTDERHLPEPSGRLARWDERDVGSTLWFRVERQTLRRLPASGAIAFTIRTYVRTLADVVDTTPGFVGALRDTMRTVTPEVAAYKGWVGLFEPLERWLGERGRDR